MTVGLISMRGRQVTVKWESREHCLTSTLPITIPQGFLCKIYHKVMEKLKAKRIKPIL